METILVYNQCVPLVKLNTSGFTRLKDGRCFKTLDRASDGGVRLPLTGKLLQFFKACGVNVQPTVKIGDSWMGPSIHFGFESFDVASSSQKGYLWLWGLPSRFHPLIDVDDLFKDHNVSLRVDIDTLTDDASNCSLKPDVMSHVVEMKHWSKLIEFRASKHVVCFKSAQASTVNGEADLNVAKLLQNWTRSDSNWKLTMSLSLIRTPKSESPDPDVFDHLIPNKRMRTDETFADFTIIAGNGTQVKCHRAVLAAQSPYFARMLKTGMKEARTGTVELPRMSAEGVRAMLDYFYTWNVAALGGNPLVCVELLEAGHQYDIEPLEKCTKKILLSKASNWYTPEAALRLILFMKDIHNIHMADLKKKAVKVFKKQFAEIKKLPAYDKLGKNPAVMKQLFEYVLTV